MAYSAPKGANDLLPDAMYVWTRAIQEAAGVFGRFGYQMVETPIFEQTEVFTRGIGEATDVVGKEMFTVRSGEMYRRALEAGSDAPLKADQKLSLRPEGTAGWVRAAVQHNVVEPGAAPSKVFYAGPMFRAENVQKGRLRQFHQIGAECLGATDPTADAELIIMLMLYFRNMGIPMDKTTLLINSMGDEACRPAYREKVRQFILDHADQMCPECQRRAQTNPLRAFDCKNPDCAKVMENAPRITDHLCPECQDHYAKVKSYLDAMGVPYVEDPTLVRGLDYYTRTVFEVQTSFGLGSQSALGGGGRYDKLVETVGGRPTPGLGFALGFERMMLVLDQANAIPIRPSSTDFFIACVDDSVRDTAFSMLTLMRQAGVSAEMDHQGRSLKSQLKLANKLGANRVVFLGPDELAQGKVKVRNMSTHAEALCDLDSARRILEQFGGRTVGAATGRLSADTLFAQ